MHGGPSDPWQSYVEKLYLLGPRLPGVWGHGQETGSPQRPLPRGYPRPPRFSWPVVPREDLGAPDLCWALWSPGVGWAIANGVQRQGVCPAHTQGRALTASCVSARPWGSVAGHTGAPAWVLDTVLRARVSTGGGGRLPGESLAVPGPPLVSSFPGPGLLSASTRLHSPLLCYIPVRSSPSLMSPWGPPPSPPSGSGWRRPCVQTQKLLGGVCGVWRAGWTCKHARPRCQRGPGSCPGRPGRQACPGPWHQAGGRERLTVRP